MTIFLIIMIPVSAMFGFTLCAMLQVAAHADRQEEKLFAEKAEKAIEAVSYTHLDVYKRQRWSYSILSLIISL